MAIAVKVKGKSKAGLEYWIQPAIKVGNGFACMFGEAQCRAYEERMTNVHPSHEEAVAAAIRLCRTLLGGEVDCHYS